MALDLVEHVPSVLHGEPGLIKQDLTSCLTFKLIHWGYWAKVGHTEGSPLPQRTP